jgi:G3E family GTPase
MEAIITIVGFLGAGKTTLLKHLIQRYTKQGWDPFVILNDYENANLDAQQFVGDLDETCVKALSGSCICCSGIQELREFVNNIPERKNGITLIEANGTSDACSLVSFLGMGLEKRFLPPIQISVVDVKNWQLRGEHNELEANQIQVSSSIILTHTESTSEKRIQQVIKEVKTLNPLCQIIHFDEIDINLFPKLTPSTNKAQKMEHGKAHWSSCSIDLPNLPDEKCIYELCDAVPKNILRIKGCTKIGDDDTYTFFERSPDATVRIRPFRGIPITGAKLLSIGPGSDIQLLENAIEKSLKVS